MKQQTSPYCNYDVENIRAVIKNSRKPAKLHLNTPLDNIETAFSGFRGSLLSGTFTALNLSVESVKCYHDLYDSKAKLVVEIKSFVLGLNTDRCPYCMVDSIRHLDHYLPRSVFPEFSISCQNLIGSCERCNVGFKGVIWGNGAARKIIHPYFDNIPSEEYLFCTTNINNGGINSKFEVKNNGLINVNLFQLMQRHFEFFDLNTIYVRKVSSVEISKILKIRDSGINLQDRKSRLQRFVDDQIIAHPINSWEQAFYNGFQPNVDLVAGGAI